MKIPIVDENDEIIEYKERSEVKSIDIYRVSSLWITNSKGNVLLAQRSFNKNHDPGKWGPAVAGTVEEGETYESNIIKEAEEELGISNVKFIKGIKKRRHGKHNFFVQKFTACLDKDISEFNIKTDEVEKVKWFSKEQLKNEYINNPDKFLASITDQIEGSL